MDGIPAESICHEPMTRTDTVQIYMPTATFQQFSHRWRPIKPTPSVMRILFLHNASFLPILFNLLKALIKISS